MFIAVYSIWENGSVVFSYLWLSRRSSIAIKRHATRIEFYPQNNNYIIAMFNNGNNNLSHRKLSLDEWNKGTKQPSTTIL